MAWISKERKKVGGTVIINYHYFSHSRDKKMWEELEFYPIRWAVRYEINFFRCCQAKIIRKVLQNVLLNFT